MPPSIHSIKFHPPNDFALTLYGSAPAAWTNTGFTTAMAQREMDERNFMLHDHKCFLFSSRLEMDFMACGNVGASLKDSATELEDDVQLLKCLPTVFVQISRHFLRRVRLISIGTRETAIPEHAHGVCFDFNSFSTMGHEYDTASPKPKVSIFKALFFINAFSSMGTSKDTRCSTLK
jgi:hypothetical protein